MDKQVGTIAVEGLKIYAHHGYYDIEQKIGREYEIDVYLEVDQSQHAWSDHIRDTVNYEDVILICRLEMARPSRLLEEVAQRIAITVKNLKKNILQVKVRISKYQPALPVSIRRFYIEIQV